MLSKSDPEIYALTQKELQRQKNGIELIASENFVSEDVLEALGSVLTNKYAEGYPNKRYYGGCVYHDSIENLAIDRVKEIFGAEHANVQPHSGASANLAAYLALAKPGDTVLAMNLDHGGHLTHGAKVNFSGKLYNIVPYGVEEATGRIDYDKVEALALENKPTLIIAGASAYAREIDFEKFSEIANKVDAKFLVDMAHIAGLVAAGLHVSPVPYADVVTSTTHKTLRGPRGGLILCKEKFKKKIDSAVFPGTQGGPLMHVIAAKAVAFKEALSPEFRAYQKQVIENAKILAESLREYGFKLISDGTDNHLVLVDLSTQNMTGHDAEEALSQIDIIVNKNKIPFDKQTARVTSGMRLGTPALTTRGMGSHEMREIAKLIKACLYKEEDANSLKAKAENLAVRFPIYASL